MHIQLSLDERHCFCAARALLLCAPSLAELKKRLKNQHRSQLVDHFGATRIGPGQLHPLTLIYGLSGSAMISATLRVPKP